MPNFAQEIFPVNIEEEMRRSYLDYAMSVIVGRALPDVRDGLKPVHRRVLYAMHELGNDWNKAYKKSARVVGDVIGKYHPHGDTAVYDAIVRMAQPFSLRYMLVDGQGNFGSVDGDSPAAMRYTEVRMARIAHALLADLDKETVDFIPNYDENEQEPAIFPARLPNLLVNGSAGIAVGMATNIPPHNLTEVINACIALLDDPEIECAALMTHIPGPDFPTGATVNGVSGIHAAYRTGRGRIQLRAKTRFEGKEGERQSIIVDELPYQVNKARLLERIGELVNEKRIEGVSALRDESDKDGMRMVIELKRDALGEVVLNNLFQHTAMQSVFGINMVALVDGRPQLLNLKETLEAFLRHRRTVVTRRTLFELRKARERIHILEGLAIALAHIDEVVALIKAAANPAAAKAALTARLWGVEQIAALIAHAAAETRPETLPEGCGAVDGGYRLSATQAQAILDLRLHRLTGLEQDKIFAEYRRLAETISALLQILRDPDRLLETIRAELEEIRALYGDERRTRIVATQVDLTLEDLINEEDMVVTLSHGGYVKSQPLSDYRAQRRGGRGKSASAVKEEDFIEHLVIASTHDTVLCFSTRGRVYWLKVYALPRAGRAARGKPINNLLPLHEGERITAILPVRTFGAEQFVFMAAASGIVKKVPLALFERPRPSGLIAVELGDDDRLAGVVITDGTRDVMLLSSAGKSARFAERDVRPMGRIARGVIGMRLKKGESVITLIVPEKKYLLTATANGYGKRTALAEHPCKGRAVQGVIAIQTTPRNGAMVGAVQVDDADEIMLISDRGALVRTRADEVSLLSRNTQGVTLMRLGEDERLASVEPVAESDAETETEGSAETETAE